MKLVDILARELKVWPDSASHAVQDNYAHYKGDIFLLEGLQINTDRHDFADGWHLGPGVLVVKSLRAAELAEDHTTAIITREQWQAAVDALEDEDRITEYAAKNKLNRSNDDLAVLVASKTFYRFGNLFWGDSIHRRDLVGKIAGSVSASDGYRYVKCGKGRNRVAAHRVIFLMHHGYLPEVIDHVNRIRDDNRIENLRDAVTEGNNQGNQSHQIGCSSVYKGVCWDAARGKWSAYAKQDGRRFNLGRFSSEEQAALAYNAKAKELFGEFANLNTIRTAEQIAKEERLTGIAEIQRIAEAGFASGSSSSASLWDAGYRKQVAQ